MFGAPSTSTPFSFGAANTATTSAPFSFQSQPATTNNLFGASTSSFGGFGASHPATTTSSFGGFGASQPAATTGLFGSSQPAATTGLFGSSQPAVTTSLFGSSQPATTTGLFGSAPTTTTGLFGQSQPAASTGLFGGSTTTGLFGQSQPAASTGLFGQSQPAASTGLFGQSQPAASTGLFGSFQAPANTSTFGSFGAQNPAQQQPAPTSIDGTTLFSALPDQVKNALTELEKHFRSQSTLCDEVTAAVSNKQRTAGTQVFDLSAASLSALSESRVELTQAQSRVQSLLQSTQRLLREAENAARRLAKLTHSSSNSAVNQRSFVDDSMTVPSPYHWALIEEFEERYQSIMKEIAAIDECLSVNDRSMDVSDSPAQAAAIAQVIQSQHDYMIGLTARVASVHEQVQELKIKREAEFGGRSISKPASRSALFTSKLLTNSTPSNPPASQFSSMPSTSSFQPTAQPPQQSSFNMFSNAAPNNSFSLPSSQPSLFGSNSFDQSASSSGYRTIKTVRKK